MRRLSLAIGLLVLAAVWLGPLPALAAHAFSAHMTMHMGVVAAAAAFLAGGLAGGSLDPSRRWPALFSPIAASLGELVVVWSWHAPGLHAFARGSNLGLVLEQGSFLLVGLWLWFSAYGGAGSDAPGVPGRRAAGVAGLLFTSMHMTLLGALLALTPRVLYDHMSGAAGMTALQDQHLGGAIMLLVGGIAYLGGGLYLTAGLVRDRIEAADRSDAAVRSAQIARDARDGAIRSAPIAADAIPRSEGAP